MSCFHAPLFFSFNYLIFLTAGNATLALEQEKLCQRDHGPFKFAWLQHYCLTSITNCHCTFGLAVPAFCMPFPA